MLSLATHGGVAVLEVARGDHEAGLGVLHAAARQVAVLERRALDVDDALRPDRDLQDDLHRRVEFGRAHQHHEVVL